MPFTVARFSKAPDSFVLKKKKGGGEGGREAGEVFNSGDRYRVEAPGTGSVNSYS